MIGGGIGSNPARFGSLCTLSAPEMYDSQWGAVAEWRILRGLVACELPEI